LISGFIANWELFIGLLLVFIMLAGEKGIWSTLGPLLQNALSRRGILPRTQDEGGKGR